MLITFKTLQQKNFKIEIEESETVKKLKEKIYEERGDEFPVDGQKLIYAGKILDDEKPLSEYKIDPVKNFVVVMASKAKPKPTEPKSGESSSSTTSTTPSQSSASTSALESSTTTTTTHTAADSSSSATTTTTSTTTASVTSAESALLTGSELETSITELMSLGYSREQVMRALNSSFHNADRAAEYLLSGNIPDVGEAEPQQSEGDTDTSEAVPAANISPEATGDLSFLRNLPQFQLMRNQLQQNPSQLPQLLQEIGRSNPQLLQLISQNQEAFIQLLNEPAGGGGGGDGGGNAGGAAGGGFQIQVTTQEKESIDRIVAMGFSESEVVQAFFACEKNEALTVEFLLTQDPL